MGSEEYKFNQPGEQIQALLNQVTENAEAIAALSQQTLGRINEITYGGLKALRDAGQLVPGQSYRIVDYVTTSHQQLTIHGDTTTAGKAFDILVTATSATSLSENALALPHDGSTAFAGNDLAAWGLRYTLDNVYWSDVAGEYAVESADGTWLVLQQYIQLQTGAYALWRDYTGWLTGEYNVEYAVSQCADAAHPNAEVGDELLPYNIETGQINYGNPYRSTIQSLDFREDGKGTILWMRDEFGNEAPYDFKNIMFRRYKVTDRMSGRTGLNDFYLVDGTPDSASTDLSEDLTSAVWAYTFSTVATAEGCADASLTGNVRNVTVRPWIDGGVPKLNSIVMYGDSHDIDYGGNCRFITLQGCYALSFEYNNNGHVLGSTNIYDMSIAANCQNIHAGSTNSSITIDAGNFAIKFGNSCKNIHLKATNSNLTITNKNNASYINNQEEVQ